MARVVIRFEMTNDGGFQMEPNDLTARIIADDLAIDLITEALNKVGYKTIITLIERS